MEKILDLRKKQQQGPSPIAQERAVGRSMPVLPKESRPLSLAVPTQLAYHPVAWKAPANTLSRNKLLFLILVAIVGGVGIWFITHEILGIFVFGLAILVLILNHSHGKNPMSVVINQATITISGRTHSFREMKSFWIEYVAGGIKELSLETKKWYLPYLKVPLGDQNPVHVRTALVRFLPEREHQQSVLDTFLKNK